VLLTNHKLELVFGVCDAARVDIEEDLHVRFLGQNVVQFYNLGQYYPSVQFDTEPQKIDQSENDVTVVRAAYLQV
jgi:hypothetical protein